MIFLFKYLSSASNLYVHFVTPDGIDLGAPQFLREELNRPEK